jgi:septal ring factor EnvC (AmiA/AmiB activator)
MLNRKDLERATNYARQVEIKLGRKQRELATAEKHLTTVKQEIADLKRELSCTLEELIKKLDARTAANKKIAEHREKQRRKLEGKVNPRTGINHRKNENDERVAKGTAADRKITKERKGV